jgi:hypothetical protein
MMKLLIKTAVHIPCHKFSYHSSKNTASSLHSLLKWVVLGLNSGFSKNAAPPLSASWHLRRNQCILEQTKVTGPPTNFHIVDFMSSVSSTIVSAPTGGRCLVVVEKLLPLKLLKRNSSPCTMSLFENWCHFSLRLHICSPHINELITLGSNKSIELLDHELD